MSEEGSRPLITPDSFSGKGNWEDWVDHFESAAAVNKWNDDAKMLWLRVRLTGRAQTAYKQLPEEARADYKKCIKGLQERFEPESKKELYLVQFQTRNKQKDEDWATFAEDLKVLARKAFPNLQVDVREQLTLTSYLAQIDSTQIGFSVRQTRPKTLDEAVAATLEMESYLVQKSRTSRVGQVNIESEETTTSTVAGVQSSMQKAVMEMLAQIQTRLQKLETGNGSPPQQQPRSNAQFDRRTTGRPGRNYHYSETRRLQNENARYTVVCLKCGKEGHYARGCATPRNEKQGN